MGVQYCLVKVVVGLQKDVAEHLDLPFEPLHLRDDVCIQLLSVLAEREDFHHLEVKQDVRVLLDVQDALQVFLDCSQVLDRQVAGGPVLQYSGVLFDVVDVRVGPGCILVRPHIKQGVACPYVDIRGG